MTEDKKNTKETQEKEEFEVVMPEANRVEMPATEFKEQPDYLKTFANFYISKFDESDLEIMDVYDGNHDVIEINTYLTNNMAFSRQNLVKHVLNIHANRFLDMLNNIQKHTGVDPQNMKTYEDWVKWYTDRRNENKQTLSKKNHKLLVAYWILKEQNSANKKECIVLIHSFLFI